MNRRVGFRRLRIHVALWHIAALFMAAIFLIPLASMIVGSLRPVGLPPPRGIEWIPKTFAWSNYPEVFQTVQLGKFLLNTVVVELMGVPVTLLAASWAGFALSQLQSRVARRIIVGVLLTLFLPETALWISRFILYKLLNLLDTPFALVAPSVFGTSPLYMLIFYWTFRRVPTETWEAARVDGAGAFRVWWSLGVPAARAAYAAVGVLCFVYYWREFTEPLLYIQTTSKYTLSVGLASLEQLDPTNWPLLMAGSVIVTVPLVIVFLVAQPFFLEPLERTGAPVVPEPQG